MNVCHPVAVRMLATLTTLCVGLPGAAWAAPITAAVEPVTPRGQYLALNMTVDDTFTTFTMTGPSFSWFAFGFDTISMLGYSLIVEGLDDQRTVVEQNLAGTGDEGMAQASQDIQILDIIHDSANDLSTVVVRRLSDTGDPEDPVFTTSLTELAVIWGYGSFASRENPQATLNYHGSSGRGWDQLAFSPVPEPVSASTALAAMAGAAALASRARRSRAISPTRPG